VRFAPSLGKEVKCAIAARDEAINAGTDEDSCLHVEIPDPLTRSYVERPDCAWQFTLPASSVDACNGPAPAVAARSELQKWAGPIEGPAAWI
jgi:hypothetical protein